MSDIIKNWDYSFPVILIVLVPILIILLGIYMSIASFLKAKQNKVSLDLKVLGFALTLIVIGAVILSIPIRI